MMDSASFPLFLFISLIAAGFGVSYVFASAMGGTASLNYAPPPPLTIYDKAVGQLIRALAIAILVLGLAGLFGVAAIAPEFAWVTRAPASFAAMMLVFAGSTLIDLPDQTDEKVPIGDRRLTALAYAGFGLALIYFLISF